MSTFAKHFPTDIIPHIKANGEINDNIHNYRRPKPNEQQTMATKAQGAVTTADQTAAGGGATTHPGATTAPAAT